MHKAAEFRALDSFTTQSLDLVKVPAKGMKFATCWWPIPSHSCGTPVPLGMRSHSPEPWAGACSHATALDPTDIKRCGNPNRSASKGDQRGGFGQAGGNRRHAKRRKPSPSTSEGSGARLRPDPEARGHTGRRPKRRLRPSRRGPEGGEGKARQAKRAGRQRGEASARPCGKRARPKATKEEASAESEGTGGWQGKARQIQARRKAT
jgi:hypothetical protein